MAKKLQSPLVDEYIRQFPAAVQRRLTALRKLIRQAAPGAEERISYQMPAFSQEGILVYFAAHAGHIGFYPTPSGITRFAAELSRFEHSKGSVQFPLGEALPAELVKEIVRFRVDENLRKSKKRTRGTTKTGA